MNRLTAWLDWIWALGTIIVSGVVMVAVGLAAIPMLLVRWVWDVTSIYDKACAAAFQKALDIVFPTKAQPLSQEEVLDIMTSYVRREANRRTDNVTVGPWPMPSRDDVTH